MITADFTGNLGNHLFQYAVTRTVAEHNNYEWGFNPTPSNDYYNGMEQMSFMNIDYGKRHSAKWRELPEGVDKEWHEQKEFSNGVWYQPFQPDVFNVSDGTKLVISCCQDARYFNKEDIKKWFPIKDSCVNEYQEIMKSNSIALNDNTCVINVRGGYEYLHSPILLPSSYWNNAIKKMKLRGVTNFIVVTDDPGYTKSFLPYPAYHFSIGMDYYLVNQSKNLIISNSSFGIFPAWLGDGFVVAPQYWAGYNFDIWSNSDVWTFDFNFIGK